MMFLSNEMGEAELPRLTSVKLQVAREDALRLVQNLYLQGRQLNALYIETREDFTAASQRKAAWLASAYDLLGRIFKDHDVIDVFDWVAVPVIKDTDSIESRVEQFHNELNQRLERLRMVRRAIENSTESATAAASRRPATPMPVPIEQTANSASSDGSGVSSLPEIVENGEAAQQSPARPAAPAAARPTPRAPSQTKVLLILCSRNGTARQALCRFGNQMNLNFEIIDYNPDSPARIVNEIYNHRDAGFAIVYWGEPTGRELPGSAHPERYVGFSLGFALGRFGRGRVFVLGSTTTPPLPGFARLLVSQLDSSGGWQIQLARRMKAAGVDIDLNLLT